MSLESLDKLQWFFLINAIIGGALFIARIILMFIGAGEGVDSPDAGHDIHISGDIDSSDGAHGHTDSSDSSFKILSLQGIMGFMLMFGALGFTLTSFTDAGVIISVISASAAGFITMWLTARLLSALLTLQSDGTVNIINAIGKEGTVYQRILPGGTGKVQIVVQNRLVEYEAMSQKNEELPTGTAVMAVYYKGNILIVDKI